MRAGMRAAVWSLGLAVLLAAVMVASASVGAVDLGPPVVARAMADALPLVSVPVPRTARVIVVELRLPRIVFGALVGFALAGAGTVMQGFFRNPMADPSIIGVSSGAAVGAVATVAFGSAVPLARPIAAFVGGVVAAFGVYLIATENGRTPVATLLLAGVAVQTFLGAVISFLLLQAGRSTEEALLWLMGNLRLTTWAETRTVAVAVPVLFLLMVPFARDLNLLLLGEEDAHTLGVEVERAKRVLLALSSLLTAAAVMFAGVIGFVGLIVPHMMRLVVGPDHRVLLPTSALAGASFLVATDALARSGAAELPVGIVTAALGAPFFLYLLRTREVHAL
ncbi:MAG: vitamin B12 ABC transporter permease BtuC [Halobacteriales archaeon]